jgi:mono/diheme cytochrome c family protein
MKLLQSCFTALALGVAVASALAQPSGDTRAGQSYASRICAECHAVRANEHQSPNKLATPFQDIAE